MNNLIVNLLLLSFQFEYLSTGLITVSRVIIFPLLCLYIIIHKKIKFPITPFVIVCLVLMVIQVISSLCNREFAFMFSAILQFLVLFVFLDYFNKNKVLSLSNWIALSSYDITSIVCYLMGISLSETSRFSGIYWDPNVMSFYILIALSSKIYLLLKCNNGFIKFVLSLFIIADVYLIITSLSRGAFLAVILILIVLVYKYSRVLFLGSILFVIPIVSYLYVSYKDLKWDSSMSSLDLLLFRIFSSGNEMEYADDGTRIARAKTFFKTLQNGEISVLGNATNIMPNGEYIHNGILEFILTVGLPMGVIFIISYLVIIFQTIVIPVYKRNFDISIILPISFLSSSVFYSYLGYKMFWFFIAYLISYKYSMSKLNYKL